MYVFTVCGCVQVLQYPASFISTESDYQSIYLRVYLPIDPSKFVSTYLLTCIPSRLSIYLSTYLAIYLFIDRFIYLSVYLSSRVTCIHHIHADVFKYLYTFTYTYCLFVWFEPYSIICTPLYAYTCLYMRTYT